MKFSWCHATQVALLLLGVATATKYEHSPYENGLAMTSLPDSRHIGPNKSSRPRIPSRRLRSSESVDRHAPVERRYRDDPVTIRRLHGHQHGDHHSNHHYQPHPLAKRTGSVTATGSDGTVTVRPTAMPDYAARYCGSYEEYFSACSEGGVAAATVTAPATTTTATETVVITRLGSYIFTKYLGIPFPTVLIPFEIPIASTIATAS
ncbi:hypothetical protein PG984_015409 [Apiospora sp. TS-2023a]